jgi:hypothetical protein
MPHRLILSLAACMLAGFAVPGHAILGGSETDIPAEAAATRMQMHRVDVVASRYRLHEMHDSEARTTVRQYSRADGKVFGVAWDGAAKPDLNHVLGPYYLRYINAVQAAGRTRGTRRITSPDFTVVVSGHMRHFTGAAWLPALVPADVDPAEIQ